MIVVVAGKASNSKTENKVSNLLYLALALNPFLTASGSIALKKMKPMNEYVVSVWLNVTTGLQSLIMMLVFNQSLLSTVESFSLIDWVLSVATAVTVISQ